MNERRLREVISIECPDIESNFVSANLKCSLFCYKKIDGTKYGLETIFPPGILGGMTESKAEVFARIIKHAFIKAEREHWEKEIESSLSRS